MPPAPFEKVAVAGLARVAAYLFWAVGGIALGKGLWDMVSGQPEANLFTPQAWSIIARIEWSRFAIFEAVFGLANGGLGVSVWVFSRRLPEWVKRPVLHV
ncbi:MAG: hypothetical protein JNK54_04430 [Elusimicrobia bacterium]|jgi:hypothetical protein|nr:hypothetical protein [Elusimicrobiota bacterium]